MELTILTFVLYIIRYETTVVEGNVVKPIKTEMKIKTDTTVGKTGVMLIGLGGEF